MHLKLFRQPMAQWMAANKINSHQLHQISSSKARPRHHSLSTVWRHLSRSILSKIQAPQIQFHTFKSRHICNKINNSFLQLNSPCKWWHSLQVILKVSNQCAWMKVHTWSRITIQLHQPPATRVHSTAWATTMAQIVIKQIKASLPAILW